MQQEKGYEIGVDHEVDIKDYFNREGVHSVYANYLPGLCEEPLWQKIWNWVTRKRKEVHVVCYIGYPNNLSLPPRKMVRPATERELLTFYVQHKDKVPERGLRSRARVGKHRTASTTYRVFPMVEPAGFSYTDENTYASFYQYSVHPIDLWVVENWLA